MAYVRQIEIEGGREKERMRERDRDRENETERASNIDGMGQASRWRKGRKGIDGYCVDIQPTILVITIILPSVRAHEMQPAT